MNYPQINTFIVGVFSALLGYSLFIGNETYFYSSLVGIGLFIFIDFYVKANKESVYLFSLLIVYFFGLYKLYEIEELLYFSVFMIGTTVSYLFKFENKGAINLVLSLCYMMLIYASFTNMQGLVLVLYIVIFMLLLAILFITIKFSYLAVVTFFSLVLFGIGFYHQDIVAVYYSVVTGVFYGVIFALNVK